MNDEQSDPPWLTYSEAGERLGLSAEAVRVRATRGKWRRMRGNDGRTLVQVPVDPNELYPARPFTRGSPITVLQEAVAALREQLQAERTRTAEQTAAERTERDRLYGLLSDADNRARAATEALKGAETALEAERQRADRTDEDRRAAEGRLEKAAAALASERLRADAAIAEAGTLREAIEGLRDKIARTEHLAERSAAEYRGAQAEAEARITGLETELRAKAAEIARISAEASKQQSAAERAHVETKEAQEQAEALRQAQEARKGRGRLRRAWDGWRGR